MALLPDLFRRYTTELWYILLAPFWFFVFMLVWTPFHSEEALDVHRRPYDSSPPDPPFPAA